MRTNTKKKICITVGVTIILTLVLFWLLLHGCSDDDSRDVQKADVSIPPEEDAGACVAPPEIPADRHLRFHEER